MATIVNERAPFRGRRMATAGLTLALAVVVGLGIWQTQPTANQPATVEQAEDFSAEAVRLRNMAKVHNPAAYGPDQAPSVEQAEEFSAEAVRIRNLAKVHNPEAYGP